jgi:leucine dehydrogenase
MSFKNIPAGIKYGGAKTVVQMNPPDIGNMDQLGFLAYAIDRCRATASPDMNMPKDMVLLMHDTYSMQWLAGPGSPLGPSGIPTAYGTFHAMKQACKFKTGSESLKGVSVALQGLGEVGATIAELLVKEGAKLIISNRSMKKAEEFKRKYPENDISIVPDDEILYVEADIFSPNATGGIITEENIPSLKFKIIIGAANNQLRASDIEEEIRLAKLLEQRGILFQADFWHNCGGVIVAFDEYELWTDTTTDAVIAKTIERVSNLTWEKLNEAKARGITPTEAIYEECMEILYGD